MIRNPPEPDHHEFTQQLMSNHLKHVKNIYGNVQKLKVKRGLSIRHKNQQQSNSMSRDRFKTNNDLNRSVDRTLDYKYPSAAKNDRWTTRQNLPAVSQSL